MERNKKIKEKSGLIFAPDKSISIPYHSSTPKTNSPTLEGCPQGGVVNQEITATINNIPIIRNFVENLPYNLALSRLTKGKRKKGILSEVLFWQQVHKGKFHKIDFDRQRIIGNYIVDFYVKTLGLVVEIDGNSHDDKVEYDEKRQIYLENIGLRVYRIQDIDVKKNISFVMMALEKYIVEEYSEKPPRSATTPPKKGNL
ncbi:MAG: endonuclease domain-containing protein [Lutibacter sp.]